MQQVLLATNNTGKRARYRELVNSTGIAVELVTPEEFGIDVVEVEETGETLEENARLKVNAYRGVPLPILANDTGFFVEGEGFILAPKRLALGDRVPTTPEEHAQALIAFWQGVARTHGGEVPAAWCDSFAVLYPDGTLLEAPARREVILTDTVWGTPHPELPVRSLYRSCATGKPAVLHTADEERVEMQPIIEALRTVLARCA